VESKPFSCILFFQEQSLIVIVIVKKIRDPEYEIQDPEKIHPGSGSRIQGVKSTGYGSGSPTLVQNLIYHFRKKTAENVGKRILQICLRIISGDSISIPIFDF
jgi:hypothetical protein